MIDRLLATAHTGPLVKLTLSKPRRTGREAPRNVYVRPITLRGQPHWQLTYRYADRQEARNLPPAEAVELLERHLEEDFRQADLFLPERQLSLGITKKGKFRWSERHLGKATAPAAAPKTHDRKKDYLVPPDRPYLHALGIATPGGEVTKGGRRKYKQINKFVEIVDGLVCNHPLPAGAHVVDMGSGSGYLTFALYDHLAHTLKLDIRMTGVELRPHLVAKCREIATAQGFGGLHFEEGYINTFRPERLDMLIALHACDTATDDALYQGIRAGAEILIVAPCCQKQVRRDMKVPNDLQPLLGHGILLERQAAMLTDALRALYLQEAGYGTKLFEFIPLEHTAKNVMITGVKRGEAEAEAKGEAEAKAKAKAKAEREALMRRFGVRRHYLGELLAS